MTGPAVVGLDRPAYRDPNALRWVAGYLSSLVGDQVWFIALAWAAVQAGTPGQVGLVLAAGSVPRALLLVFGGALADRWGVRRTAIASDGVRTAIMLAAAAVVLALPPAITLLVVLAVAFGTVDAVFLPATAAMPAQLVGPAQLTRMQGLRSTAQRVATSAGAPIGGLLVAVGGAGTAFGVAAVGTALSVLALLFVRVRPGSLTAQRSLLVEVRAGLSYVRRHRVLLPLIVVAGAFEFGFAGPVNVGLPVLAQARGWGAGGVGLLLGAFGIGATVTALALVAAPPVPHVGRWFAPLAIIMAAALTGMGMSPSLLVTAGCAALVGAGAGLLGSLFGSLVLTLSEASMVARVSALATLASLGLSPVSYALTGAVAGALGAGAPFLLGGLVAALSAVTALVPPLWRAELIA